MKKGTKRILIVSTIALAGAGAYVLTNKKLKLKLGLPVKYKSDNDKKDYNLVYSKYGETVLLTALQGSTVKGYIALDDNGKLMWNVINENGQGFVGVEITNVKDADFLGKLVK